MTAVINHSEPAHELIAKYDPCKSYNVYTPNRDYKGQVQHIDFTSGHAFVQGLPKSASGRDKLEFAAKLAFFADRGYDLEVSNLAVRDD